MPNKYSRHLVALEKWEEETTHRKIAVDEAVNILKLANVHESEGLSDLAYLSVSLDHMRRRIRKAFDVLFEAGDGKS